MGQVTCISQHLRHPEFNATEAWRKPNAQMSLEMRMVIDGQALDSTIVGCEE